MGHRPLDRSNDREAYEMRVREEAKRRAASGDYV